MVDPRRFCVKVWRRRSIPPPLGEGDPEGVEGALPLCRRQPEGPLSRFATTPSKGEQFSSRFAPKKALTPYPIRSGARLALFGQIRDRSPAKITEIPRNLLPHQLLREIGFVFPKPAKL